MSNLYSFGNNIYLGNGASDYLDKITSLKNELEKIKNENKILSDDNSSLIDYYIK